MPKAWPLDALMNISTSQYSLHVNSMASFALLSSALSSARRNERAREMGDPRENPPTSGIIRHDSRMRKSGVTRTKNEPDSPCWKASSLTAQPLRPPVVAANGACLAKRWQAGTPPLPTRKQGGLQRETRMSGVTVWQAASFSVVTPTRMEEPQEIAEPFAVTPHRYNSLGTRNKVGQSPIIPERSTPMQVTEVSMERHRNEGAGEAGDPREYPSTNGIVRHDWHMRRLNPDSLDGRRAKKLGPTELEQNALFVCGRGVRRPYALTYRAARRRHEQLAVTTQPPRLKPGKKTWVWSSAGVKGRGKWDIPEKTRQTAALSGTIPKCENPGVIRPGIEPSSPWWEASRLTARPPAAQCTQKVRNMSPTFGHDQWPKIKTANKLETPDVSPETSPVVYFARPPRVAQNTEVKQLLVQSTPAPHSDKITSLTSKLAGTPHAY
ncbi:hypothetical protein PR048_023227 [Dryococelus australis]|uniref:Uncharacterized protein n=1 Tax=Dryococelus australis TaxID=614101 RepID=A0ABQ9GTI0_9NEOP|nr:hypothetical protein PR048_023227 [Dryococelus australis]